MTLPYNPEDAVSKERAEAKAGTFPFFVERATEKKWDARRVVSTKFNDVGEAAIVSGCQRG